MNAKKRKRAVKQKHRVPEQKITGTHKGRFNQLLDDAIFGVKKKVPRD